MKSRYLKLFSVVGAGMVILLLGLPRTTCANLDEEFKKQLLRIRNKSISTDTLEGRALLEENCLKLVKDHNSPTGKGMIYATITLLYSRKGLRLPNENETRLAKIFEYGKKAIEQPIPDVLISCEVHGRLAGAMFVKAKEGPQEKFAETRREAIIPCLKGLKLALYNKAPKKRPEMPPPMFVPNILTPHKGPAYKKARENYKKQLAQWKQYRHLCALYKERNALTRRCVTFYSNEPCDTQEFRKYAQKILVGYEDVVNDLVGQIEKRIQEKERRRAELEKLKSKTNK